jgi:hypothetical protein
MFNMEIVDVHRNNLFLYFRRISFETERCWGNSPVNEVRKGTMDHLRQAPGRLKHKQEADKKRPSASCFTGKEGDT